MPRVTHWTWLFMDQVSGKCSMCSKVLNTVCTSNAIYHLRTAHKLVENCPEHIKKVEEANLAVLQQMRTPQVMEAFDKRDMSDQRLDYVVWFAIPVSRCEDPRFRVAHPELPKCRTTFREKIVAHCVKRHDAALAKFVGRRCTLAFDSGTIWNKYMCVVLCSGRLPPLVYEVAECHSATAVWTKDLLQRVIIELKAKKIFPLGLVADNASNVQAAAADIEVSSNLLSQRCMAHSLQLAIEQLAACHRVGQKRAPQAAAVPNRRPQPTPRETTRADRASRREQIREATALLAELDAAEEVE